MIPSQTYELLGQAKALPRNTVRGRPGISRGNVETPGADASVCQLPTYARADCRRRRRWRGSWARREQEAVKKSVGRRKRLPHKAASPSTARWDRRFRLSTRRTPDFFTAFRRIYYHEADGPWHGDSLAAVRASFARSDVSSKTGTRRGCTGWAQIQAQWPRPIPRKKLQVC